MFDDPNVTNTNHMDKGKAFIPPAPIPRTTPPKIHEIISATLQNPISLWGQPAYEWPWIESRFLNERFLIANDPDLIHYLLVENAKNYRMATVRQLIIKPILRDGLLTAEGEVWKRTRKSIAPVFAPRHSKGFADLMLSSIQKYNEKYEQAAANESVCDISVDMTELTYEVLAQTLFSGDIAAEDNEFSKDVDQLLETMGKVDPLDLIKAPSWIPRLNRLRGKKILNRFRKIVSDTIAQRRQSMISPDGAPDDFLTLLLNQEGEDGLTHAEIEDNIITFIGAGHETTARALAWALYLIANSHQHRDQLEAEADKVHADNIAPVDWLDAMPWTRAVFEEALRLYPPAPSINRAAIEPDSWTSKNGETIKIAKGTTILVLPWTLHRHKILWDKPEEFRPERFLPENKSKLNRYQYLPFGVGPRVCIGAAFAMQEAVIALGSLLHTYRFDLTPDTNPWPVQRLTVQPKGGIPLKISKRCRP